MLNLIDQQFNELLDSQFEAKLNELLEEHEKLQLASGLREYQKVSPQARARLRYLLRYYAKKLRPFTACVRDNRKRFGPRAEAVCAVLKDMIRGTTKWRGNRGLDKGSAGLAEPEVPVIDDEVLDLVDRLSELDLWNLLNLAELDGEPTQAEAEAFYNKFGRDNGSVTLRKDSDGFYIHTHRSRSISYKNINDIPSSALSEVKG